MRGGNSEDSSPAMGGIGLPGPASTRSSIWKRFRVVCRKLMPIRGCGRWTTPHRRRLAAFEALRGLAEPIGLSGLRSGN